MKDQFPHGQRFPISSSYNFNPSEKISQKYDKMPTGSSDMIRRRAFRRTDNYMPGTLKLKLVEEVLPPLEPTSVLIKVHAVSLNYRDANIANGGNPWPVLPNGILCNDAAGEVIAIGDKVKRLVVGDRVSPITDTKNISGREIGRSWLAADEDGVMADHIVFDENVLCKLPDHLDWNEAATIPCAGVTAWSALKGMSIGQTVLIQGKQTHALNQFHDSIKSKITNLGGRHWRRKRLCAQTCKSSRSPNYLDVFERRKTQANVRAIPRNSDNQLFQHSGLGSRSHETYSRRGGGHCCREWRDRIFGQKSQVYATWCCS
jgi:hypothetical protein